VCPPTINLDNPSVETKINLCANKKVEREINIVQSNSFGFGGTNACLIMGKVID
jgi:3-oxoacyl-[acyl-carrier-protein] synthase II